MTLVASSSEASSAAPSEAVAADERIAHRGPMRRWLISPEIGALIGAIVVWVFLWGNGETFGTAGTTLNWLDVAAPYGIMATAIALLMIGGEFDLSSGVITGGTAMIIGLMSRFFTGTGMHIGWAILAAFAAAGAIGFFNGYMVNKTGLPSFIITLASFFVIQGLMLVLSKRLAQKVYVDQIKEQRGAAGFKNWIAHEWILQEFTGRDAIFLVMAIGGAALFVFGLLEHSFIRRSGFAPLGVGAFVVGLVAAGVGFFSIHRTDGVGANVVWTTVTALGAIAAIVGLGVARWQTRAADGGTGEESVDAATVRSADDARAARRAILLRAGLGVAGVAMACVIHFPFDRNERRAVLTWIPSGLRPVVAIAAALAGIAVAARSLLPGMGGRIRASGAFKLALFSLYAGGVVMALAVSVLQLTTVQALRATAMTLLGIGGLAMLLSARGLAAKHSRSLQLVLGLVAAAALIMIGLVSRVDSSASRFRTVLPAACIIAAALLVANTLCEYLLVKRTFAMAGPDRAGRWLQVVGGLIAVVGCAIRVLFSNLSDADAAIARANNQPVPQNVLRETVMWWLIVAAAGAYVLAKTRWGNWIFAVGGNKEAARAVGVPANRVKIALFVTVGLCGALAGTLIGLRYGTVQANQGVGLEFEFIIAAVVGGCLMTGGYGSVVGASLGAAVLAMSSNGFQTVKGWNSDARFAFLGGVLLVAVLVNTYIRKKALEAR
jgi:simple sugar transport system permease protein